MSTDEQRVRTMCGWVGVEISKSQVRSPGKVGYGLYRVRGVGPSPLTCGRGSITCSRPDRCLSCYPEDRRPANEPGWPSEWTAYAFTLEQIDMQVALAIQAGTPGGPGSLNLYRAGGVADMVPTRWTSAYRGRRDLGVAGPRVGAPSGETARQRQRRENAEFQADHLERRSYGLRRRHAEKERRIRDTQ